MLRSLNSWLVVSIVALAGSRWQAQEVNAQPPTSPIYLPALQRGAYQLIGDIGDIHTVEGVSGFMAIDSSSVVYEPEEPLFTLWISRNGGIHWERPVSQPWGDTTIVFGRMSYAFLRTPPGLAMLALIVGYDPSSGRQAAILFRSEDYGLTWSDNLVPIPTECVDRHIRASMEAKNTPASTLYLQINCQIPHVDNAYSTFTVISTSTDMGQTWVRLPDQPVGGVTVIPSPADSLRLFRIDSSNQIHTSDDKGMTWQLSGVSPTGIVRFSSVDPDRLTIISSSSSYWSVDAGRTWREQTLSTCSPAAPYSGYVEVASNSVIGYAACADGKIIATTDAGISWTEVANVPVRRGGQFGMVLDRSDHRYLLVPEYGVGGALWRVDRLTGEVTLLLDMLVPIWPG